MVNKSSFWKKPLVVFVLIISYLVVYYLARPNYLENLLREKNPKLVNTPAPQEPEKIPEINLEDSEKPKASDYFKDLAYEVAGVNTDLNLTEDQEGKLDVKVTIYVSQIGKERDLMVIARRWISTFITEAYLSPYDVNRVLVTVVLSANLTNTVEVSVGKNQVKTSAQELREMTPHEFCNWVKENETQLDNLQDMTFSKNYSCS